MTEKQRIRAQIETLRRTFEPSQAEMASEQIIEQLLDLPVLETARTLALYLAFAGEVNLDGLFPACAARGIRTCVPVFHAPSNSYRFAMLDDATPCRIGHYGIREPIDPVFLPLEAIDVMIIPGVAFDARGNRLGRGGGYYDRLLAAFDGFTAGVAFAFQLVPCVPTEPHDRSVQVVVTETNSYNR